ncbi:MAG: DUF5681 domain-containing protein [Rhodospirillales bacterium]|nr:DUF5681 domain-containing protein [Rhodospirillales bacterium]
MAENEYEIGYKKPPKHTQFKPGQSGNSRGRPKGAKDLKTELMEELSEKISIKESGQPKKVSKQRAVFKTITARAVQGDTRAANILVNLMFRLLHDETDAPANMNLTAADEAILTRFEQQVLDKMRRRSDGNE